MKTTPFSLIDEPVEVSYDQPPLLEKTPTCPSAFTWRGRQYCVQTVLAEWSDFQRRGRMARNMQPNHARHARLSGSWGVGRYYFRLLVEGGRIFEIYFDRAPRDSSNRKGNWYLLGERRTE